MQNVGAAFRLAALRPHRRRGGRRARPAASPRGPARGRVARAASSPRSRRASCCRAAGLLDALVAAAVLASSGCLLLAIHDRPGARAWIATAGAFLAVSLAAGGGPARRPRRGRARAGGGLRPARAVPARPRGTAVAEDRRAGRPAAVPRGRSPGPWRAPWSSRSAATAALADALAAPLVAVLAYMLVEQGYLSPLTSPGYADRLAVHRRLSRESAERLLDTQRALEVQDRLVAAGLLALGASHEYRNVLAALRAAAGHGLACPDAAGKDRSLRLVLEHALRGRGVRDRAPRAARSRRPRGAARLAVRTLLERLARTVRPVARHVGVRLLVEGGDGLDGARPARGDRAGAAQPRPQRARRVRAPRGTGAEEPLVRLVARGDGPPGARRDHRQRRRREPGPGAAPLPPRPLLAGEHGRRDSTSRGASPSATAVRSSTDRLDGGSCFTLELPRVRPPADRRPRRGGPPARPLA